MPGRAPSRTKVTAASALGGAIATLLVWILDQFFHIKMPAEAGAALSVVMIAIVGWLAKYF